MTNPFGDAGESLDRRFPMYRPIPIFVHGVHWPLNQSTVDSRYIQIVHEAPLYRNGFISTSSPHVP